MSASRSLIALLVGTVAFFALWMFALKGNSSSTGGSGSQGLGQYQSDINAAHQAVQTSNASNAASGNDGSASSTPSPSASAPSSTSATASGGAAPAQHAKASAHSAAKRQAPRAVHLTPKVGAHNRATVARLSTVESGIRAHKVVAMLFYNPGGADDVAVRDELAAVSTHRGRVVKLTIPLGEAANFTPVTQQVPVNFSPTLVLIAPNGQAGEIVGYSDRFEIAQRVDDALAAK